VCEVSLQMSYRVAKAGESHTIDEGVKQRIIDIAGNAIDEKIQ